MLEKYTNHTEKDKYIKESLFTKLEEAGDDRSTITRNQQRAFTVIPVHNQKKVVAIYDQQKLSPQQPETLSTHAELWPSLEQLEELIRHEGKKETSEVEQLELPLYGDNQNIVKQYEDNQNKVKLYDIDEVNNDVNREKDEEFIMQDYPHHPLLEETQLQNTVQQHYYSDSWLKVAMAVFSSILTGVLIGYVLLLAVYGVKVWPLNTITQNISTESIASVSESEDLTITATIAPGNIEEVNVVEEAPVITELPTKKVIAPQQTFTYTAFQAGVFTKEETKQAMISSLRGNGYPAVDMKLMDGKDVIFAGVASSKESSFQVTHMSNIELYRKPFSIYVSQLSDDTNVEAEMQQWVYNIHDVLLSYMKMSEAQFEQVEASSIYGDSYAIMEEKYKAVVEHTSTLRNASEYLTFHEQLKWHQEMLQAIQLNFVSYQTTPNYTTLFSIQQQLLTILAYQAKWFEN